MKYYFKNPANTAPLLVLAVFLLLYSSRLIDTALLTRENEYVAVIVLQRVIFLMPAAFYIRAWQNYQIQYLMVYCIHLLSAADIHLFVT